MAKGKFRSLRVERGENGFAVHSEHDDPAVSEGNKPSPYHPPKPMFFDDSNHAKMMKHIHSLTAPKSSVDNKNDVSEDGLKGAIQRARPITMPGEF